MILLSCDPGAVCGFALWVDGTLRAVWVGPPTEALAFVKNSHGPFGTVCKVNTLVIEIPTAYPSQKVDPNDLIRLAIRAGIVQGIVLVPTVEVQPRSWKGQVPKEIHNARVMAALNDADRAVAEAYLSRIPAAQRHNAIDAIGLGQWHNAKSR